MWKGTEGLLFHQGGYLNRLNLGVKLEPLEPFILTEWLPDLGMSALSDQKA
jgi:hypothetical protein